MQHHHGCRYMHLRQDVSLEDLAAFHGHLGPFIVIGYRIGIYARDHFCDNPFELTAKVYCSGTPPQSCLADGIQLGSGCTLGKQNIGIVTSEEIAVEFEHEGQTLRIVPHPFAIPEGSVGNGQEYEARVEALAEAMFGYDDFDLFSIQTNDNTV